MKDHQIEIDLKKFRSINQAHVVLDGISVIAGENGSGKSTISKLIYNLFKTSIDFDKIIDKNLRNELSEISRVFNLISIELRPIIDQENYNKIRNYSRKSRSYQLSIFEDEGLYIGDEISSLLSGINLLIDIFKDNLDSQTDKITLTRLNRLKQIISSLIQENISIKELEISSLLVQLKESILNKIDQATILKEDRPLSILYNTLNEAFDDIQLSKNYDVKEFGVSITDTKQKKLIPIHSIRNIAYIDTPMIIGVETYNNRNHWDDLNSIVKESGKAKNSKTIESIFKNEILKGEVIYSDDENLEEETFRYKRIDGMEFNLLECATGLKSFAILQLMYKNGFLNKQSLLIIDEPEVHLHPQWVVEYARLIVLLNKHLGVKFLIASHHPDMISAIKYISEKEKIDKNVYFYLAEKKKDTFTYNYKDLGKDIEPIFSSFNIAFERIDLYGRTK